MKIEKAIEILGDHALTIDLSKDLDLHASIHLGIEALKRVRQERTGYESYAPDLLPGETGE